MKTKTPEQVMQSVRVHLLIDHPYFAQLLYHLDFTPHDGVKYLSTDGDMLWYNPEWIDTLDMDEVVWGVAHEGIHCALLHHLRRNGREKELYNVAADHATNILLKDLKVGRVPRGIHPYCDERFREMLVEEIYAILEKERKQQQQTQSPQGQPQQGGNTGAGQQQPKKGQQQGSGQDEKKKQPKSGNGQPQFPQSGPGSVGDVIDAPKGTNKDQAENQWRMRIEAATAQAASQGKLPGALERTFDLTHQPVVDWRPILWAYIEQCAKRDYSYRRPSRRYIVHDLYMPTIRSDKVRYIVFGNDTSGSVSKEQMGAMATEMQDIFATYAERATVVHCDSKVQRVQEFDAQEEFDLKPSGGGGTSFKPAFDWVEKSDETPSLLLYFTDGRGTFPDKAPEYPVIWVRVGQKARESKQFPFGDVITMDPRGE